MKKKMCGNILSERLEHERVGEMKRLREREKRGTERKGGKELKKEEMRRNLHRLYKLWEKTVTDTADTGFRL